METHEMIKQLREQRGMSQDTLAEKVGYKDRSSIAKVEAGLVDLSQSKIAAFAKALGVSPAILIGVGEDSVPSNLSAHLPSNMEVLKPMKQIPLVGEIACGVPILAQENITDYVDLPDHVHADYALKCRGDSMINANIHDGDIVYIRQQTDVNNGQIAAVMVDGNESEATLKRFYRRDNMITLIAENPAQGPMVYVGEDMARVHVLGLAVGFTHMFER